MFWGAIIGAVISAGIEIVAQRLNGQPIDWRRVGQAAVVGAVTGLVGGAVAGRILQGGVQNVARNTVTRRVVAGTTAGSTGGAAGRVTDNALQGRPLPDGVIEHAAAGAVIGAAAVPVEAGVRRAGSAVLERIRTPRTTTPPPRTVAEPPPARGPPVLTPGRVEHLDPHTLRFTQTTAGATADDWTHGLSRADALRQSMRQNGWVGDPVDGVITPNGVVLFDNTRAAVARELGLPRIPVRLRAPDELLPEDLIGRFGPARTWGEAIAWRAGRQNPPLPPDGSLTPPRLPTEGTPPRGSRSGPPGGEQPPPHQPQSEGFLGAFNGM